MQDIKREIFVAELARGLKKIDLGNIDLSEVKKWHKRVEKYIKEGYGTYMMMIGKKMGAN